MRGCVWSTATALLLLLPGLAERGGGLLLLPMDLNSNPGLCIDVIAFRLSNINEVVVDFRLTDNIVIVRETLPVIIQILSLL